MFLFPKKLPLLVESATDIIHRSGRDAVYEFLNSLENEYAMKKIIFIFLFLSSHIYGQQINSLEFLFKNPDKVMIATVLFQDKTTIPISRVKDSLLDSYVPIPIFEEPKEVIQKIEEKELSKKEITKLIKLLQKRNKKGVPLPYVYDIQLDFYKEGTVLQVVTISSVTEKIVVRRINCIPKTEEESLEEDVCYYMGVVSDALKKYLTQLLREKHLWGEHQCFDEDML